MNTAVPSWSWKRRGRRRLAVVLVVCFRSTVRSFCQQRSKRSFVSVRRSKSLSPMSTIKKNVNQKKMKENKTGQNENKTWHRNSVMLRYNNISSTRNKWHWMCNKLQAYSDAVSQTNKLLTSLWHYVSSKQNWWNIQLVNVQQFFSNGRTWKIRTQPV